MHKFEPTVQAARARLSTIRPEAYARTRNHLDGAVTRLSPYITHGLLSLRDIYADLHGRFAIDAKHKLVFELGWRAYYRHVWAHLGQAIHQSLHSGLLPDSAYQAEVPPDVLQARTGIAAIDLAVRELYATGYLHNHARMWLASYLVHMRKVHWHTAAQWMLGHLLDGDVASNHLSWQWVAGTGSTKPYLFNADNVAKYAPAPWHSPATVIDTSYEALDRLARSTASLGSDPLATPPGIAQPSLLAAPSDARWTAPDPHGLDGRDVCLLHPWSLGGACAQERPDLVVIGLGMAELHAQAPWSERRWDFVTHGLLQRTPRLWWGNLASIAKALQSARSVCWHSQAHINPQMEHLRAQLQAQPKHPAFTMLEEPHLFEPVATYCESFSKWWRLTRIAND